MEITIDTLISLAGLFIGGGGGAFFMWRWQRRKAKAEAQTEEVRMAQAVQDTYQEMLEDKQKEVDDNHRLIAELREDRDHYKQGYIEFRDKLDKLDTEFRNFRKETEEERAQMKRDIASNGRQLDCLRPSLCGREDCALRVPVTISQVGELEKTIRSTQQKPQHDSQDIKYVDPVESDAL